MVPESEPHLGGVADEGEIGSMHQQIERPVREDGEPDQEAAARRAGKRTVGEAGQHSPAEGAGQAVRERHVVEIEGVGLREARDDTYLLGPDQHEDRPGHVDELNGDEEQPERDRALAAFRDEAGPVVADEHVNSPPSARAGRADAAVRG
jgi:hypothetical protein